MLFLSVINAIRWLNMFDEMAFGIDFCVRSTIGLVSHLGYKAQIQVTSFL